MAYCMPLSFTKASSWFKVGPGPPDLVPIDVKATVVLDEIVHPEEGPTMRVLTCGSWELRVVLNTVPVAALLMVALTTPASRSIVTVTGVFRLLATTFASYKIFATSVTACFNSLREFHSKRRGVAIRPAIPMMAPTIISSVRLNPCSLVGSFNRLKTLPLLITFKIPVWMAPYSSASGMPGWSNQNNSNILIHKVHETVCMITTGRFSHNRTTIFGAQAVPLCPRLVF